MIHALKCWREQFAAIKSCVKCFEWRKFDRPFQIGDTLQLDEWDHETEAYTGKKLFVVIDYMVTDKFGIPGDYVIMSWGRKPTQSASGLESCPFCNKEAEVVRHGTHNQSAIVSCEWCGATLETNEIGVGYGWNRRYIEFKLMDETPKHEGP